MNLKRKPIFFTSDHHFGHYNSITYDNRPFTSLAQMHRVLINNYNASVPKDGVCYFLGDFGQCDQDVLRNIVSKMNGTKIFILGNHDKKMNSMYNVGFDVVLNNASLVIAGELVTMAHCPLRGLYREDTSSMKGVREGELWHGESRHKEFSIEDQGQFHLHGHVHSPNGGKSQRILKKQFDVGIVANKYRPVSISIIESFISKYKKNPSQFY